MSLQRLLPVAATAIAVSMPVVAFASPAPSATPEASSSLPGRGVPGELEATLSASPGPGKSDPTGAPSKAPKVRNPQALAMEQFWTPERMAQAKPVDEQAARAVQPDATRSPVTPGAPSAPAEMSKPAAADQVGLFFFASGDGYKFCSGTVVPSQGKNLVATAAHCFDGSAPITSLAFVPGHRADKPRPAGIFPVDVAKIHMASSYAAPGGDRSAPQADYAFAPTTPRTDGKSVEDAVGAIPVAFNAGFDHSAARIVSAAPGRNPAECNTKTKKFTTEAAEGWAGGTFLRADCGGKEPSTSGSPFIVQMNGRAALAGLVGGWKAGGDEPGAVYSAYLDDDAKRLYEKASTPESPATPSSSATPSAPKPSGEPSKGPVKPSRPAEARLSEAAELDAFWSPERMSQAKPVAEQEAREAQLPKEARKNFSALALTSPSKEFEGIKEVGTFYWAADDQYRFCAGTVVPSPGKNLVATAAHCFDVSDRTQKLVFVPKHSQKAPRPYGVFPVDNFYMDPSYAANNGDHTQTDLDFAFLQTAPRADGVKVEDAVGAIPLALNAGLDHPDTQVIGYPYLPGDDKYKPNQNPLNCITPMKKFTTGNADGWTGGTFAEVNCKGYVSGTSGGPFLIKQGNGRALAGVTGGWKTGGHSPDTSYSSYFGDEVQRIYDAAVAGRMPDPRSVLPPGETWKHAKGISSGYFTADGTERMDMFVMWTDGEVSLYRGASSEKKNFDKEFRVMGANATWRDYAVEITAGNFTGDERSDVIVRWTDGEVSLYPSVDENGFHGEIQIQAPNDDWRNYARQFTAGRFSPNGRQDDLVVTWKDGEVSLYTDVSEGGMGTESQVLAPNDTWKYAAEIGSGDYTGNDNWDLIIRWSDGELTNYQDFNGNLGSSKENTLNGPDDTWKHAIIVSGGDYSENAYADDTIVRWSDGELTLYSDGNESTLGQEKRLVAPAP
ncbi:trypsin-like serine protease [Streptomyces yangpuensis]|uniref:trypsin-like serine peptidase n=1 Tax=Streptomyces yangpuensis TaxID=1648182 RepID=UPI00380670C6